MTAARKPPCVQGASCWAGKLLLSLAVVLGPGLGWGQPCITCRTEACPDKPGLTAWCEGKEPQLLGKRRFALPLRSPPPQRAAPSILFLGVSRVEGLDEDLGRMLAAYLVRSGERLAEGLYLSPADRKCTAQECLQSLATRSQAPLVLSVIEGKADESRFLRVRLFDARARQMEERTILPDPQRLKSSLEELITGVLRVRRGPPLSREIAAPRPKEVPRTVKVRGSESMNPPVMIVRRRTALPGWRKGLAGALGGAAALTLAASIMLSVEQHAPAPGACPYVLNDNCIWNFTPAFSAGYAVTGALVIGLGLTLGLR